MPDTSLDALLGMRFTPRKELKYTPTVNVALTMDQLNALIDHSMADEALIPLVVPTLKLARINLRRSLR